MATETRPELIVNGGDYDAAELLRGIRAELAADSRRQPESPLAPTVLPAALHDDLARLNLQARVDTASLPQSDRPGLAPLVNLGKRAARPFLAWFVVPLLDRVSDYFVQLVGYLYRLQEYLEQQARAELPARVARLERAQLANVPLPPPGAGKPVDLARYYDALVAPRGAAAEIIKQYCGGTPETVILGAGRGELAAALAGKVRQVERIAALAGTGAETPADYLVWLQAAPLAAMCTLVIDDWAGDWGADRLQAALDLAAQRLPRGSRVTLILPLAVDPPYPLLYPGQSVAARVAAFLAASAGLKNVTSTQPAGLRCAIIRGEII